MEGLVRDQETMAVQAVVDGYRIMQLKKQTRGLAEAVIALTPTSSTLAPAIRAVTDEM
jgi:hypothetical protein